MDTPLPTPPRPIPPGRAPQVETFKLPGGGYPHEFASSYETLLHVHRPPAGAPAGKLPVLYLHGVQSHPAWFYASARALANAGHTVYQLTRRGSGANDKQRGHACSADLLHRDLRHTADAICRREGTDRLHLAGVSWGGKWATATLCESPRLRRRVASVTLVCPGMASLVDVPLRTKLLVALVLWPYLGLPLLPLAVYLCLTVHPLACFIIMAVFSLGILPLLPFPLQGRDTGMTVALPLGEASLFTDNQAMREYIRADAFSLRRATLHFLWTSRCMDRQIARSRTAWDMPATLILAKGDRIIDNAATLQAVQQHAGGTLEVVELDGAHTLEFQPDPQGFFDEFIRAVERV